MNNENNLKSKTDFYLKKEVMSNIDLLYDFQKDELKAQKTFHNLVEDLTMNIESADPKKLQEFFDKLEKAKDNGFDENYIDYQKTLLLEELQEYLNEMKKRNLTKEKLEKVLN